MRAAPAVLALLVLASSVPPAFSHDEDAAAKGAAVQPSPGFELPEAGSYELPAIARVEEAQLLDPAGERAPLLGLASGDVAVVSFVYTRCAEGQGCPAALATLQRVDRLLADDPSLAERVHLVTVSFDPTYDTPQRMADLRSALSPVSDWRFLTAKDPAEIEPVLAAFGQDALPLVSQQGEALGLFRHVLKVFLVDANGAIRNIYSSGFLSPELLLVDVRTVLMAQAVPVAGGATP